MKAFLKSKAENYDAPTKTNFNFNVIDVENVSPLLLKNHFSMTAEALEAKASDEKLYIRMRN